MESPRQQEGNNSPIQLALLAGLMTFVGVVGTCSFQESTPTTQAPSTTAATGFKPGSTQLTDNQDGTVSFSFSGGPYDGLGGTLSCQAGRLAVEPSALSVGIPDNQEDPCKNDSSIDALEAASLELNKN